MLSISDPTQIIDEALTWIGTPYHDCACVKGVGVDCVHLLIGVAREIGILAPTWKPPRYTPGWHSHQQSAILHQTLIELGCREKTSDTPLCQADILTFRLRFDQSPSHAGFAYLIDGTPYVIHALYQHEVRLHRLAGRWQRQRASVYALPGADV